MGSFVANVKQKERKKKNHQHFGSTIFTRFQITASRFSFSKWFHHKFLFCVHLSTFSKSVLYNMNTRFDSLYVTH